MPHPVAIQLYTLHAEADRDFGAVLKRVAEIGYVGVEIVAKATLDVADRAFARL